MGTPLMWYAFNKTFELYDNLIFFPFKWNPIDKKMYFVPKNTVHTWLTDGALIFSGLCYLFNLWLLLNVNDNLKWKTITYIQFFVSLIQLLLHILLISFAIYYTLHGEEMAILFSDSYRAMIGAIETLKVSYLLPTPPFHRDILGIVFTVLMYIAPAIACAFFPFISVFLRIDPLYGLVQVFKLSPVFLPLKILTFSVRLLFTFFEYMLLIRWFNFSLMQLFLVLTIGNTGLCLLHDIVKKPQKYRHLPQKPGNAQYVEDFISLAVWQQFIITLVIIQRRILLQTRFWSYRLGINIFILVTIGIILWSVTNYALIVLASIFPTELVLFAIGLEAVFCFLYGTLIPYVTAIEKGSRALNEAFKTALMSHKLGRRYVKTLATAMISTPFFSFRRRAIILLFRIPFEVTLNLVLTFPG